MTDRNTSGQKDKELFDLLYQYADSHNIGGTLQILDTLLHMLDMVVKGYVAKNEGTEEDRNLHQERVKEIVFASKEAIGQIVRYCDNLPSESIIEKKLIDTMPVGVCVTNILGKVHYANPKFMEITGIKTSDLNNINITSLYTDTNERKRIVKELKEIADHEDIKNFKIPLQKNGKAYLVESIERQIDWEGKHNCMLAVVIERTDAKNVENEMKKAIHGDVTMEQMLKTISARAEEKKVEEAKRIKLERENKMLLGFTDSLINMVGNIVYLEDNMLGKDIYSDLSFKPTNCGLFVILVLNGFEDRELVHIFGRKCNHHAVDYIKRELLYGVSLHDLGKIGIKEEVLLQDGKLSEESRNKIIKDHVDIGAHLVKGLRGPFSEIIKNMVLNHHKNLDGSGYPRGEEHKLDQPRELLVKWFDVFYSFVARRPYRNELHPYETITREFLFKDKDLNLSVASQYPEKCHLLLKKLHLIFDPGTTNEKFTKVQDSIKRWLAGIRKEQERAAARMN
ncbi:MAG: PAS domain S-box protein [bacterium]|nr:PAS domain S-box protein [bacterium]